MTELMLGIETSCDDTGVAVVEPNGVVRAGLIVGQTEIHNRYGGVYPEMASRAHIGKVIEAVDIVMGEAGVRPEDLSAISVTRGPGLIGSLMVGVDTARGLAQGWELPLIGVNHLRGHLRSADLEEKRVEYPALVLLVSGGHTLLAHMSSPADLVLLGSTRDDSVGEAYDKVARMLDLGYPGGPPVDKLARTGSPHLPFPRPMMDTGLDFSFSGLKSAVARYLDAEKAAGRAVADADVTASFVQAVLDVLVAKVRRALSEQPADALVIVGGVAASPPLRARMQELCDSLGVKLCLPPIKWSTDNGAMIAMAGWDYLERDIRTRLSATSNLRLDQY
jgi:tRNA N6-adenosine threonylcarbamoyltransferase